MPLENDTPSNTEIPSVPDAPPVLPSVSATHSLIAQIESEGKKVLAEIEAKRAEHESYFEIAKDELTSLAEEVLQHVSKVAGVSVPTSSAELKDALLLELTQVGEHEIEPEILIELAVKLVKRAVAVDPNAKVKFEQAYEAQ